MKKFHFCVVIVVMALLSCHPGTVKDKERLDARDWFQKGMAFEKQDVQEEAIRMYTQAIALNHYYAEAYFRRGKAHMASHKTNTMEALADFDKAIALDPANADAYYERGLLHFFIINNEKGRDDMRMAARLGHKEALNWLAAEQEKGKKMEHPSGTVAVVDREGTQIPTAGEGTEMGKEKESRSNLLGQYLASGSEPVVYFDHNRSNIKQQYLAVLDEIANVLKEKIPETNIVLAGHTDSTGTEKYNDQLSLQRAKAVESYLRVKKGIPSERMTVQGYGENDPIASNETEEGQAKNRRVEILPAAK